MVSGFLYQGLGSLVGRAPSEVLSRRVENEAQEWMAEVGCRDLQVDFQRCRGARDSVTSSKYRGRSTLLEVEGIPMLKNEGLGPGTKINI